jgi:hypothetical protein
MPSLFKLMAFGQRPMAASGGLGGEGGEYLCSNIASQKSDLNWSGVAADATNALCLLWWVCHWAGVVDGMAQGAKMWQAPDWLFFRILFLSETQ